MKIAGATTTATNVRQGEEVQKRESTSNKIAKRGNERSELDSKTLEAGEASSTKPQALGRESAKDIGSLAKNINNTIGSLDVMIRSIHTLQSQSKAYQKLATKMQALANSDKEKLQEAKEDIQTQEKELASKAAALKERMQATFDSATFGEENVFAKSYKDLVPESQLDAKKLSPSKLTAKQPENLKQYVEDLREQRVAAKEAKKLLKRSLDEQLDAMEQTDSRYEKLDVSRLRGQEFKAAQGGSGVTLDRVLHLLR